VLTRAFEPFSTTKFVPFFITNREGQGTGLGLSMAYGVLTQSNSHIRIYSEVGSGAAIEIYLSRSMQPEVDFSSSRSVLITGGTETILVVEDDAVVQATVVDTLQGLGKQVLGPSDGQAALAILQSGIPVDMIFSNVVMPGPVRSIDMARQAKQLSPGTAVLFTSGHTQYAIVHGGRLNPGVELISKPYRREALARKIRQVIAGNKPDTPATSLPRPAPSPVLFADGVVPKMLESAQAPLQSWWWKTMKMRACCWLNYWAYLGTGWRALKAAKQRWRRCRTGASTCC
jgi:CheY-like chemotaxis protein